VNINKELASSGLLAAMQTLASGAVAYLRFALIAHPCGIFCVIEWIS